MDVAVSAHTAPSSRWALLVAAAAALAVVGALWPPLHALHYVAKPASTLLVALLAWRAVDAQPAYRRAVLAGLLLSTLGDIWLMLPWDLFVAGLVSFLLAHLAYLYAFTRLVPLAPLRWPFAAYAALAAGIVLLLWSHLPAALRAPVLVYVAALATMAAQAAVVATQRASASRIAAAAGGLSFVVSDALLAIDRFHTPLPYAALWVLASYWLAQFLIGRSVWQSRA
ncbi:lysoplasmalogenase [Tahibacter caeni]|uniref:lysoplasmalogenase n=1 Tax=Tahibacter caeni TaxID=1453545 RepID=UPI0021478515|nr:lysoplasmalogenase [Tahibacter caeni]